MVLTSWVRALAVGGFDVGVDVGVEGARQLVAMACAAPPLPGVWMLEIGQVLTATASQAAACATMPAKQRLRIASPDPPRQVST